MKRYHIAEVTMHEYHAGTKATEDISAVADRMGFKRLNIRMDTFRESAIGKIQRQAGYARDWKTASNMIEDNSVLLLQHPFHHKQITRDRELKKIKEKSVRVISLVHDVEELRAFRYSEYYRHEFDIMVEIANIIIVHNEEMKKWFVSRGVQENKLICLEIFDYLTDNPGNDVIFDRSITIAGNLDQTKCGYIGHLGEIKDVTIHLYGSNYSPEKTQEDHIIYHGAFPPDVIPAKLTNGFGLVWDGSDVSGCCGESGQYLKYNNPHKLSLYLSAGMPVILWSGAAEAAFVRENGLGICVDDLRDLRCIFDTLGQEEYHQMLINAGKIGKRLRGGYYSEKAIHEALVRIGD